MKTVTTFFFVLFFLSLGTAQNNACNKLGVWLWHLEITGFETHEELADSLSAMGAKRVFVKVADGKPNPSNWPELLDSNIPSVYKSRGIECWAWSYNYTNDPSAQAEALYFAAQTGYEGFIVDVEMQFDGVTTPLYDLFDAFDAFRNQAIIDGHADADFNLYCTTWGNPKDHNFHIELIDPHVDGFMPQTYVEQWGSSFIDDLEFWIEEGEKEYAELGATKPIHHIVATEYGDLTTDHLNRFIAAAGGETSLWRIPGGGTSLDIWQDWKGVEWDRDFCAPTAAEDIEDESSVSVFPNPASSYFFIDALPSRAQVKILDLMGNLVYSTIVNEATLSRIDIDHLPRGSYFVYIITDNWQTTEKLIVVSH